MRKFKEPLPKEVTVLSDSLDAMADNVRKLSDIGTAIKSSRMSERAVLVLLKDMTGIPQRFAEIGENVLEIRA